MQVGIVGNERGKCGLEAYGCWWWGKPKWGWTGRNVGKETWRTP